MGHISKVNFTEPEMLGMLITLVNQSQRVSIKSLNVRQMGNGKYKVSATTYASDSDESPEETDRADE